MRSQVNLDAESRRSFFSESLAAFAAISVAGPVFADEVATAVAPPAKVNHIVLQRGSQLCPFTMCKRQQVNYGDYPVPSTWGIGGKDYYSDAALVLKHMEYATQVQFVGSVFQHQNLS
jgi:hypothetical protein